MNRKPYRTRNQRQKDGTAEVRPAKIARKLQEAARAKRKRRRERNLRLR